MFDLVKQANKVKQSWRGLLPRHLPYDKTDHPDDEAQRALLKSIEPGAMQDSEGILYWWGCILLKGAIVFSYVLLLCYVWFTRSESDCIAGNERIYKAPPVVYEAQWFQRAGFHDSRHGALTTYEGEPNDKNEASWDNLLSVGILAISHAENSLLEHGSALSRHESGKHIVQLEMFHQLHCLKWIRDQFWNLERFYASSGLSAEELQTPQRVNHTDHCIDYLRQVIMCHGDITPMTFEWNKEIDGYLARHRVKHSCRNFDAIFDWAGERAAVGMTARGKHQNVELQHSEMFD